MTKPPAWGRRSGAVPLGAFIGGNGLVTRGVEHRLILIPRLFQIVNESLVFLGQFRLSVSPVTPEEWAVILEMAGEKTA